LIPLKPNERYRGRSYPEWIEEWSNLLVSSSPDYQNGVDMLFLRGNLDYEADKSGVRYVKPGKFFDRTGSLGLTIYKNTALFIPVMSSMYSINDAYESAQLLDEEDLRNAVRNDISQGGKMWLRFKESGSDYKSVLGKNKLEEYYFETAVFTLRVSNQSPLIDKFETAFSPGEYETVQGGYFVILKDLAEGTYRFDFGGFGRGFYYTAAICDITVKGESRNLVDDVSQEELPKLIGDPDKDKEEKEKAKKRSLHLKIESEIEDASPF
jgi:hypothetical protein